MWSTIDQKVCQFLVPSLVNGSQKAHKLLFGWVHIVRWNWILWYHMVLAFPNQQLVCKVFQFNRFYHKFLLEWKINSKQRKWKEWGIHLQKFLHTTTGPICQHHTVRDPPLGQENGVFITSVASLWCSKGLIVPPKIGTIDNDANIIVLSPFTYHNREKGLLLDTSKHLKNGWVFSQITNNTMF